MFYIIPQKSYDATKKDGKSHPEYLQAVVEQARKEADDLKAQTMREEKILDELRVREGILDRRFPLCSVFKSGPATWHVSFACPLRNL